MESTHQRTLNPRKFHWKLPVVAVVFVALAAGFLLTPKALAGKSTKNALAPGIITKAPANTFTEHVAKINASPEFFVALAKQPDPGPTINLNLAACLVRRGAV